MKSPVIHYAVKDNLRTIHLASPSPEVVHIRIAVDLFDVHQKNKLLLGFYADMLEKGSKRFSKDAYEETLESLGADLSIGVSGNTLNIGIITRTVSLARVISVLRATFDAPLFRNDEIAKLKKEYIQGFHELQNDTRHLASALLSRTLYAASALEYIPTLPEREALLISIDKKMLQEVHASLREGRWFVTVAGPHKAYADIKRFVSSRMGKHVALHHDVEERVVPVSASSDVAYVPGKQNVELFMGNHVPLLPTDSAYSAFAFGVDVLGKRGGFAGRLMSTVREKEGLTYSIYAWLAGSDAFRSGYMVVGTFFTPKDIQQGLTSTMREIRKIVAKGVTDAEMVQFKTLLGNQFTLTFESVKGTVALYHSALVRGLTPEFIESYPHRVLSLTKKEVNTALRTHLNPDCLVIAAAGTLEKLPNVS